MAQVNGHATVVVVTDATSALAQDCFSPPVELVPVVTSAVAAHRWQVAV